MVLEEDFFSLDAINNIEGLVRHRAHNVRFLLLLLTKIDFRHDILLTYLFTLKSVFSEI